MPPESSSHTSPSNLTSDSQIARHVHNAITAIHSASPDLLPPVDTPSLDALVAPMPKQRTLEDVRLQVARSIAARAVRKAQVIDGSKTGVVFTLNKSKDHHFLKTVALEIRDILADQSFLFALTTDANVIPGQPQPTTKTPPSPSTLVVIGSNPDFVGRANLLTCSKFLGRTVALAHHGDTLWTAGVHGMGSSSFDELALHDIVAKSVRNLMEPLAPPPRSFSVDQLVSNARSCLERLTPARAYAELTHDDMPMPVFLIDLRAEVQRRMEGTIRGAIVIDRNELEWRFDPRSPTRLKIVDRFDIRVILMSRDGGASSLAAYTLHQLGLMSATDIIGGYAAWKKAGLPSDVNIGTPSSTVTSYE